MQPLLALKKIHMVTLMEEEGDRKDFCFTDAMLKEEIFIEVAGAEYGHEPELWGINQDADEDEDEPENETTISVILQNALASYEFHIFISTDMVVPPVVLYGIVLNLVDIISNNTKERLIEFLPAISTGVTQSTDFEDADYHERVEDFVGDRIRAIREAFSNNN